MLKIKELETPCLVLNRSKVQRNITTIEQRLARLGASLRPHGKTAKCIDVIRMLAPQHQKRITVSTLKEAEYFFSHDITDILLAVGITPSKLPRLKNLIEQGAQLTIILDSIEQVVFVSQYAAQHDLNIKVLIEIDCDGERAGIPWDDDQLLAVGRALIAAPGVTPIGIMTHAGGSYHCKTPEQMIQMAEQERTAAVKSAQRLTDLGIHTEVISVGSTPTALFAENLEGITEVRAGVFMFNDLVMAGLGVCHFDDIALTVLTSVMGRHTAKQRLLVDAGWMALSRDRGTASQLVDYHYGAVADEHYNQIRCLSVNSTNQEHGIIECQSQQASQFRLLFVGTLLHVFPNHACATAAMHDRYYVTDDGVTISDVWHRVNGW
ncbi:alanine racemase [Aliiglaciecola litoralis]|uniref:DSD1 family PLP-dependent enzyme n=1 Tax=Aliiglaciecola litoralis TaxID=582857 RepID=A0ABN1LDC0_9ALTE